MRVSKPQERLGGYPRYGIRIMTSSAAIPEILCTMSSAPPPRIRQHAKTNQKHISQKKKKKKGKRKKHSIRGGQLDGLVPVRFCGTQLIEFRRPPRFHLCLGRTQKVGIHHFGTDQALSEPDPHLLHGPFQFYRLRQLFSAFSAPDFPGRPLAAEVPQTLFCSDRSD